MVQIIWRNPKASRHSYRLQTLARSAGHCRYLVQEFAPIGGGSSMASKWVLDVTDGGRCAATTVSMPAQDVARPWQEVPVSLSDSFPTARTQP